MSFLSQAKEYHPGHLPLRFLGYDRSYTQRPLLNLYLPAPPEQRAGWRQSSRKDLRVSSVTPSRKLPSTAKCRRKPGSRTGSRHCQPAGSGHAVGRSSTHPASVKQSQRGDSKMKTPASSKLPKGSRPAGQQCASTALKIDRTVGQSLSQYLYPPSNSQIPAKNGSPSCHPARPIPILRTSFTPPFDTNLKWETRLVQPRIMRRLTS